MCTCSFPGGQSGNVRPNVPMKQTDRPAVVSSAVKDVQKEGRPLCRLVLIVFGSEAKGNSLSRRPVNCDWI